MKIKRPDITSPEAKWVVPVSMMEFENQMILKQAECDGLGSELMILQSDCIKANKRVKQLEQEVQDLKREAFNVALKHNCLYAKLELLEEKEKCLKK